MIQFLAVELIEGKPNNNVNLFLLSIGFLNFLCVVEDCDDAAPGDCSKMQFFSGPRIRFDRRHAGFGGNSRKLLRI